MLTKCIENPVDEKKRLWKQEDHGEYGWELIVHLFTTTRIRVCYVKLPVAKSKTEKKGLFTPQGVEDLQSIQLKNVVDSLYTFNSRVIKFITENPLTIIIDMVFWTALG